MNSNRCVQGLRVVLALLVGIGLGVDDARAADGARSSSSLDERRWIPSVSIFTMGGVDQRQATASADTSVEQGQGPLDGDGQSLGLPWSTGGALELTSPILLEDLGRPRLFTHIDLSYAYDLEDPVLTIGDPGFPPTFSPPLTSSASIQNVGASVRAEAKPLTFSGGLGISYAFDLFDRELRLRPSLEWMYRRDTMKTVLGGGEAEAAPPSLSCIPACRTLFIKSETEKGFHSIGPGFELEADVGRMGEFLVGWYGSFRAFYIPADRKANLKSRGSWQRTDGNPTNRADTIFATRYERDPWHYRFGMGLRVYWSPEN